VAEEFLEHANEEQGHADRNRRAHRPARRRSRILNPEGLASRSHSQYVEGDTLVEMIAKT